MTVLELCYCDVANYSTIIIYPV